MSSAKTLKITVINKNKLVIQEDVDQQRTLNRILKHPSHNLSPVIKQLIEISSFKLIAMQGNKLHKIYLNKIFV